MIKELRKLGGTWKTKQIAFGTYEYEGNWLGSVFKLKSFAHICPRYDGDDDNFVVKWHIYRDDKEMCATEVPVFHLETFFKKDL